jgi:hypothetical protein
LNAPPSDLVRIIMTQFDEKAARSAPAVSSP